MAGLALFTQIQLVLRLPRHRRIDHNLGNTGNVRIHKSGNGQICYWKIPQIHNSLKLFLTELNQCHSHAFYHVRKYLQKCIPFQFHTSEFITHQHTTYKDIDKRSPITCILLELIDISLEIIGISLDTIGISFEIIGIF